jgi:ribosome-binding factor A
MPRHSRGRRAAPDGSDPELFFFASETETDTDSDSARRRHGRKDAQLCAQVQRAIEDALACELDDERLAGLWVVRVEPAPDLSLLRVWLACAPDRGSPEPALVLARLAAAQGVLRAEVAAAIHRKRVPALTFALWAEEREP